MSEASSKSSLLKLKLSVVAGPEIGKVFDISKDLIRIGRNPDNDISLPSDLKVSRYHVEILVGMDRAVVRNISEKNYLLIDGTETTERSLQNKDVFQIGASDIRVEFNLPLPKTPVTHQQSLQKQGEMGLQVPTPSAPQPVNRTMAEAKSSFMSVPSSNSTVTPPPTFSGAGASYSISKGNKPKPAFIGIVLVVAISAGYLIFGQSEKKKQNQLQIRDAITTQQSIQASRDQVKALQKDRDISGKNSVSYDQAQAQFLKGFRDYRNGNYIRAAEQFAAALAFFPEHEQSRRYYHLALRKQEEFTQYHFNLGKRYYGLQNYRLCSAHFGIVIRSKRDEKDLLRQEAIQLYKECELRQEGRF